MLYYLFIILSLGLSVSSYSTNPSTIKKFFIAITNTSSIATEENNIIFTYPQDAINYALQYSFQYQNTQEIHVIFRQGIYILSQPLILRNTIVPYLKIYAYPNEKVIISGTVPLTTMAPITPSDPLYTVIPMETLQTYTVLSGSLTTILPMITSSSELYWNDTPQIEARWPDAYVATAWATANTSWGAYQNGNCIPNNANIEPYYCAGWARSDPIENWTWNHLLTASNSSLTPFANWTWQNNNRKQASSSSSSMYRIRGYFTYDWSGGESIVQEYFPNNRTVLFTDDSWNSAGYWGGSRYYAVGAPEALSLPGEYFMDTTILNRIYWVAPYTTSIPPSLYNLSISTSPSLVIIENMNGVSMTGLTFVGCTEHCIIVNQSSNINIMDNVISGAGGRAIDAHSNGNYYVNITNNFIAHTGVDSIWVNGSICQPSSNSSASDCTLGTLAPSTMTVTDNIILNSGRLSFAFSPAIGLDGVFSIANHNLVLTNPACGIMFGGALQQITNNIVIDALRESFDMGVLCDGPRDWTVASVTIANNALLRNGYTPLLANHVTDSLRTGLYLDYGNFGHNFLSNVVWHSAHPSTPDYVNVNRSLATRRWGVYNHGGRNFNSSNNIVLMNMNNNECNTSSISGGIQSNDGGLVGGDKTQLINGSHYYISLQTCGIIDDSNNATTNGWQIPPCSTYLNGLSSLDDFVSPNCSQVISCPPAPYNLTITTNIGLLSMNFSNTTSACFFQGPPEPIPVNATLNYINQDPLFEAGTLDNVTTTLNFQLQTQSPAYQTGYQYINMSEWGPRWLSLDQWKDIARILVPWAICPEGMEQQIGCVNVSAVKEMQIRIDKNDEHNLNILRYISDKYLSNI